MSRVFAARIAYLAAPSYAAPPLAAFEAWRVEYGRAHPGCAALLPSAGILRRIVQLRSAGDSFAEIARCCGLAASTPRVAFKRLPEELRGSAA